MSTKRLVSHYLPVPLASSYDDLYSIYHDLFSCLLQSPLTTASLRGRAEVVALLLKAHGIDVNKEVRIVICLADHLLILFYH